jgi:hypothetical protein
MREILQQGVIVLQAATAAVLVAKGVVTPHRALVAYLIFGAATNTMLLATPAQSPEYLRAWAAFLPIATLLSVATGWQAYGRSLEASPRIRLLSHRILFGFCVGAALLAQFAQETVTAYGVLSRVEQGVSVALGLFGLAMLSFLHRYYSPRRRANAVAQECILTVYYLGNALAILATHWQVFPFNAFLSMTTSTVCCLAWMLALTREGETLPPPEPAREDDRLEKLAAEAQFDTLAAKVKSAARSK